MTRRSFLNQLAAGAIVLPCIARAAVARSTLSVVERNNHAYAVASELAQIGIAVKELPGQSLVSVCFEDRCGTIKEFRREVSHLYAMIGPLAKALGMRPEFTANRREVTFSVEPRVEPPFQLPVRSGQLMPDFRVTRLDGRPLSFSHFQGRRVMIVNWASWCVSRNDLQVWERVYKRFWPQNFDVLAIAADVQGPALVRTYAEKQQVTFTLTTDPADVFGRLLGLKGTPVSAFVDEVGILRFTAGGPIPATVQRTGELLKEPILDVRGRTQRLAAALDQAELEQRVAGNPEDWAARLPLARALDAAGRPAEAITQVEAASRLQPRSAEVLFVWGLLLWNQRLKPQALAKWKQARDLEPDNFRIRRNIWSIENPDKFYRGRLPDLDWQTEQVKREKA